VWRRLVDVALSTAEQVRLDGLRWAAEAVLIVGRTDVFIYPFGAQPPAGSPQVRALRALGFKVQCGIDIVPRLVRADGVSFMSRRHVDGIAFSSAQQRAALASMFDTAKVEDVVARR
jgi:hypothetical protein